MITVLSKMKKANQILILSAFLFTFMITKSINVMQGTQEIWKDVVGYERYYKVSNLGNVISLPRNGTVNRDVTLIKSGPLYDYVTLQKNGSKKRCLVHRLVAIAFIPNPQSKKFINHKNGIKKDNSISNLEWCTQSENELHAHRTGLKNFKMNWPVKSVNNKTWNAQS